ncbi:MAG: MFS transporter [Dermatophilaceae bacterium]
MPTTLPATPTTGRRWAMLGAGTFAQAASAVTVTGPVFLIPALHDGGLSLAQAGLVAASPTVGVMLTLVLWGVVVDRQGERFALLAGLIGTALASAVSTQVSGAVPLALALFTAGAAAASVNSASGRVVVGWFPAERRGLAMGIRQMAQPVGVGIAALTIAVIASEHGIGAALWIPTVVTALSVVAVAAIVIDPPRPGSGTGTGTAKSPNPYRGNSFLARIHGVSVLLVVPQFVVWTFALVWLVQERGWSPGPAGVVVAITQLFGASGRIIVGALSDRVGSRMRPLRWVALLAVVVLLLLGFTAAQGWAIAIVFMGVATAVTVADNGLAFTAVAERAGPFWSGRALGIQNTAQFLAAAAVPPLGGLLVTRFGFAAAFALSALLPLIAAPLVPVRDEGVLH